MQTVRSPRSDQRIGGSRTARPMMAALDLLGQRWTLRVIWELQNEQPLGFRELARRGDQMSSSVLADRLRRLTEAGVIATSSDGRYQLSELGMRLGPALQPLQSWAEEWSREVSG